MIKASCISCLAKPANWLRDIMLLYILLLSAVGPARASPAEINEVKSGTIAVIYPDIGEPYLSIFMQIIKGIDSQVKAPVARYATKSNVNIAELNSSLHRQNTKVVIALGRQGMKIASALDRNFGVIVGGILTVPENEIGEQPLISLSPDPALLFAQMKSLMPETKRILTIYNPRQNAWIIRMANEAARSHGLELVAYEAQDLRSAMRAYQEIFTTANNRRDAIWLPQDSIAVEEGSALPLVLNESWNRNLAVFSSSFDHVRRGALFALYPDNVEMGRHLASSALSYLNSGRYNSRGMTPLRAVQVAINLRTAKHLDISPDNKLLFDVSFPE